MSLQSICKLLLWIQLLLRVCWGLIPATGSNLIAGLLLHNVAPGVKGMYDTSTTKINTSKWYSLVQASGFETRLQFFPGCLAITRGMVERILQMLFYFRSLLVLQQEPEIPEQDYGFIAWGLCRGQKETWSVSQRICKCNLRGGCEVVHGSLTIWLFVSD